MKGGKRLTALLIAQALFPGNVGAKTNTPEIPEKVVLETILYEAAGEPLAGQIAVAGVIKQRMIERRQTAEGVVTAKRQFSCNNPGVRRRAYSRLELDRATEAWLLAEAQGFNHYCRVDCHPCWAKFARETKIIGNHKFMKI